MLRPPEPFRVVSRSDTGSRRGGGWGQAPQSRCNPGTPPRVAWQAGPRYTRGPRHPFPSHTLATPKA